MASSSVSSKGQVTIPLSVRERLGLREGDRVEFVVEDGKTVLRPARETADPFAEYVGALPAFGSRDEVVQWVRELRDDEDGE
jgi:AbrB family looped-hinge helix DNA binding protein